MVPDGGYHRFRKTFFVMKNTRQQSLKFHVESGDYFGTLATVLHTLQQITAKSRQEADIIYERSNKQLQDLKDDLLWLQANYRVIKK